MKAVSPLSHYSQPNNKRHKPCCNLSTTVRHTKQVTAVDAIWTTKRAGYWSNSKWVLVGTLSLSTHILT